MRSPFHLRPRVTLASIGPEFSAGTEVEVVATLTPARAAFTPGGVMDLKRVARMFRVRVIATGREGFAFVRVVERLTADDDRRVHDATACVIADTVTRPPPPPFGTVVAPRRHDHPDGAALALLLVVGATASCGASQHAAPPVASPTCRFRGGWTDREIGGALDRSPFAYVVDGFADGVLRREPDGPTLHLRVSSHGWVLVGTGDLGPGRSLLARRQIALGAGVIAHADAAVTVRDTRPGEALVGADPSVFGDGAQIRFLVDPTRRTSFAEEEDDEGFDDE